MIDAQTDLFILIVHVYYFLFLFTAYERCNPVPTKNSKSKFEVSTASEPLHWRFTLNYSFLHRDNELFKAPCSCQYCMIWKNIEKNIWAEVSKLSWAVGRGWGLYLSVLHDMGKIWAEVSMVWLCILCSTCIVASKDHQIWEFSLLVNFHEQCMLYISFYIMVIVLCVILHIKNWRWEAKARKL